MLASIFSPAFHVAVPDSNVQCLAWAQVCESRRSSNCRQLTVLMSCTLGHSAPSSMSLQHAAGMSSRISGKSFIRSACCHCPSIWLPLESTTSDVFRMLFCTRFVAGAVAYPSRLFPHLWDACCHFAIWFSDCPQRRLSMLCCLPSSILRGVWVL